MKPRRFAEGTTVAPEKSRAEIEKMLVKTGATSFAQGWTGSDASITCVLRKRTLRFRVKLPTGARWPTEKRKEEQEARRRWRALVLIIKAKLEALTSEVYTFDEVFLADIVLPNTQTVGEWFAPQLATVYEHGSMPPMLGAVDGGEE